jgi:hypothetical protein
MVIFCLAATATRDEFLLAFAQGLTGMLAIAASVLGFLMSRAITRSRTGDSIYRTTLAGLVLTSLYVVIGGATCWWAWHHTAPARLTLLFDWPTSTWLAVLFAPLTAFGLVTFIVSAVVLWKNLKRWRRAKWPA